MGKIGRNETCPCGSGKKYKNCCLDRDEEERRNSVIEADFSPGLGRTNPGADAWEPPGPDGGVIPDFSDRWGEFWDQAEKVEADEFLELARRLFEEESGLDEDIVADVFNNVSEELQEMGRSDEIWEWVDLIQSRHPAIFDQVAMNLGFQALLVALPLANADLTRPLRLIASGREEAVDFMLEAVYRLFYKDRIEELAPVLLEYEKDLPPDSAIFASVRYQLRAYALEAVIANFMRDDSWQDPEDPEFWRMAKPLIVENDKDYVERVKDTVLRLGGRRVDPFRPEDYGRLQSKQEVDRLIMLRFEFAGYLRREKGWALSRALLGSDQIFHFLIERKPSKKRKTHLLPDAASADAFVSSNCQPMFPQSYHAAAFSLALKPWMEFLAEKGYVETEQWLAVWQNIRKKFRPLPTLLAQGVYDPPMVDEVRACLEEQR